MEKLEDIIMIKDCLKRRISNDLRKDFGDINNFKEINIGEYINKYMKEFPYLSRYTISAYFIKVLNKEYDLKNFLLIAPKRVSGQLTKR